jgi:isoquinoline 1-oxidoreductase beta subunit
MEPPAIVAKVDGDSCEVWTATQNPQAARKEAARELGIDESKVRVNVTLLGGGFGRKSKADYVSEAVFLARAAKAPVRVQWTREDDVRHDYYHTVSAQRLSAALDANNKVTAWLHRSAYPPIGSTFGDQTRAAEGELQQGMLDVPLAIPNVRAENAEARAHVRIGWLRSVCNIFHAFAINSFIDELAHARSVDPRDNMLEVFGPSRIAGLAELGVEKLPNYKAPLDQHPIDVGRLRHVIERVTELSSFRDRKKNGRALGLAAHRSFLSYTAAVVSVVRVGDKIKVDEAWLVGDFGTVVNAERVRSQMEGAIIFGMSIALYGAITAKGGAVEQSNFRDFKLVRIAEAPRKVHTEIVVSERLPGGVGEPGVPPIAPAIANAVFALTGQRIRELPLTRAGLV